MKIKKVPEPGAVTPAVVSLESNAAGVTAHGYNPKSDGVAIAKPTSAISLFCIS